MPPTIGTNDDSAGNQPQSVLRVLLERRIGRSMAGRVIDNVDELLGRCSSLRLWAGERSLDVECESHTFGKRGLAEDIQRVRWADVLVGVHGAGLANGFFMRRGSAPVEARPYGFEGLWPDSCFKNVLNLARPPRLFHLTISMGSPELCRPNYGYVITKQVASYARGCTLPWESLRRALERVAFFRLGTARLKNAATPEERYVNAPPTTKTVVAYAMVERAEAATRGASTVRTCVEVWCSSDNRTAGSTRNAS